MDVHIARHNHDAGRMLARRRLDAHAAMGKPVDIGNMLLDALFLEELLDIAKGRLIGDSLDGTCAVDVVLAEEHLGILMCDWLIGTREVQIDIRDLIAIETEEDGKGDIMAVLDERLAADRTGHVRQVIAAAIGTIGNELAVLAVRAAPMRRQRIYLGDARHRRDEGRADRTTGADQIAVVVGFFDETLGDKIQNREAMADDRLQLLLQSRLNDLGQVLAIHGLGPVIGHRADLIVSTRNHRRIEIIRNRLEGLDHLVDLARIRDDSLIGQLLAEIVEFLEHLLRRAQVERRRGSENAHRRSRRASCPASAPALLP